MWNTFDSFNKAHSASYGITSYQTAWLKYHYPIEFYCALMSSEKTDGDGQKVVANYIQECKRKKISLMPPDINNGVDAFVPKGNSIQFKLTMISGLGDSAIQAIENLKPITSFDDFMERRAKKDVRNNVVINLIKAGCFDFTGENRNDLIYKVELSKLTKSQITKGLLPDPIPYSLEEQIHWEYEALGMYISEHPLQQYEFQEFNSLNEGQAGVIGGWVREAKIARDKKGNNMAFVTLETADGFINVLLFSSTYEKFRIDDMIKDQPSGTVFLFDGKKSGSSFLADEVELCRR